MFITFTIIFPKIKALKAVYSSTEIHPDFFAKPKHKNKKSEERIKQLKTSHHDLKKYDEEKKKTVEPYLLLRSSWNNEIARKQMVNLMFSAFMGKHKRSYKTKQEAEYRREIFKRNLKDISEHNDLYATGHVKFHMGVTGFADLTEEEFMRRFASADLIRPERNHINLTRKNKKNMYQSNLNGLLGNNEAGKNHIIASQGNGISMISGNSGKGVYFEDQNDIATNKNGTSGKAVYFEDLKAQEKNRVRSNYSSTRDYFLKLMRKDLQSPNHNNLSAPQFPSIDWKEGGWMTPVENQGGCGACYSFASVAATEIAYMKQQGTTKGKKIFSKQEMVDCGPTTNYYLKGCRGGVLSSAYSYLDTFGIGLATDYPYSGTQNKCRKDQVKRFLTTSKYTLMKTPKRDTLLDMVATNPTSLAIEVKPSYQHFTGGYVDVKGPCGFFFNHAILAVGYDTKPKNLKYMLLKNTYGIEWGEDGYMKYLMGIGKNGMCGFINDNASYPIL